MQNEIISFHKQMVAIKFYNNGYNDWRKQMIRVLKSFELDVLVSGACECPRKINEDETINEAYRIGLGKTK